MQEAARPHAAAKRPATQGGADATSRGLPCRVYQFARSRSDCTLMAPWRELLASAVEWTNVRLFAETELVAEGGARKTQDILTLRQGARFLWTFRPDDLEEATLSFVGVPRGDDIAPCMLLDVRPMLADANAAGFSYVVMFERDGHARSIRNLLLRSWCSQKAAAGEAAGEAAAKLTWDDDVWWAAVAMISSVPGPASTVDERDEVAEDVVEDDFLIALLVGAE